MRVNVLPEGVVTITGRERGRNRTRLTLTMPPLSQREARRLERICNSGSRQTEAQGTLTWGITDAIESHFVRDDGAAQLVRVLRGDTILRLMNNRAPLEFGDFGPILYERAEKRLRGEGKLSKPLNGYTQLEALFRDAVAREFPNYLATWRTSRHFSENDVIFIKIMTGHFDLEAAVDEVVDQGADVSIFSTTSLGATGELVQLTLQFDEGELLERLNARVRAISRVCEEPLTHARRAPREERTAPPTPTPGAKRHAAENGRRNGYFRAFTGDLRPIPLLNQHTVMGLAKADGALDRKRRLTQDDYLTIARAASDHRCRSGVGGGVIVPESAELYVRIFRAIGLSIEEVEVLGAEQLTRVTRLATTLHKLAAPEEVTVH